MSKRRDRRNIWWYEFLARRKTSGNLEKRFFWAKRRRCQVAIKRARRLIDESGGYVGRSRKLLEMQMRISDLYNDLIEDTAKVYTNCELQLYCAVPRNSEAETPEIEIAWGWPTVLSDQYMNLLALIASRTT